MDALKRTGRQFGELFTAMTPSQRLTLVVVPVVVLAAFGVLIGQSRSSSTVPLSWGKVFTIEQLRGAEQTLIEAGLADFRTEGQRIFVPAGEVERYNAALLVGGDLPGDAMSEFERQFEKTSVFTSREQLAAMKEIALQNELKTVLRAVPEIEDAAVTWARSEARRWPDRQGKVTATVSLRPRRGRPLEPRVVRSIRAAVAGMIPDLPAEAVTVFDQSTGTAFESDRDDPLGGELARRIESHAETYRHRIADALAYIPEVIVSVNVDVDNLKSRIVREQTVDSKQTVSIETSEQTRSTDTAERAGAAEPGAASNTPRQLQSAAAPTRTVSSSESDSTSRVVPSYTVTEKEFLAAMPTAVQVSVSIPEGYHRDVALARGFTEGSTEAEKSTFRKQIETIRAEEEEKARRHALTLIPAGSPESAVNVTSVTRLAPTVTAMAIPWPERLREAASAWGSTVGLTLLAAWGLLTLSRSMPKVAAEADPDDPTAATAAKSGDTVAAPPPSKRDALQSFVRDNPEAAAAVVGRWITSAKG